MDIYTTNYPHFIIIYYLYFTNKVIINLYHTTN